MKTFKWTIPEPLPSEAEERGWRRKEGAEASIPTKREFKEFKRWEKVRKRGLKSFILRSVFGVLSIVFVIYLLHAFDIYSVSESGVIGGIGGLTGSIIGSCISWHRYKERRPRIQAYLQKQCEPG